MLYILFSEKYTIQNLNFRYLNRFEHELSIIKSRHKDKSNRRFASREDIIRHTKERELEEYNNAGIGKCNIFFINNLSFQFSEDNRKIT